MPLLNVRLGPEDGRRAAALRRAGVKIAGVVRAAIREEYERHVGRRARSRDAAKQMAEIYAACPDPPDLAPRLYDLRDRAQARRAIVEKMRVKRR